MKRILAAAVILAAGCASGDAPSPAAPAQAAGSQQDARLAEMQVAMTELLERLDVMSERIARLEEGRVVAAPASPAAPSRTPQEPATEPVPAAPRTVGAPSAAVPMQRALAGAQLADEYRAAMALFGRGAHAEARKSFERIFEADRTGDLADNALFWIGETWFAAGDYTAAIRYYRRVVADYGEENKAPDALLKTGMAIARTGDLALARTTFQQVIADYPYSSASAAAKAELQRIRF